MTSVMIMEGADEYVDECVSIGERLDEYFNAKGLVEMREDLMDLDNMYYVARDTLGIAGFVVTKLNMHDHEADILWMAVRPPVIRSGVGTKLLGRVEHEAHVRGIQKMRVRTLAEEADYEPYVATRLFYEANGFEHVLTIPDYPLWEEGNPCAVYEKEL